MAAEPCRENSTIVTYSTSDVLSSIVPLSSVFLKDRFELHRDGFVVYPSAMKHLVSDELVALCKAHFDDDAGEDLFNNHRDVGSRHNDGLRLQRSIDAGELGGNEMAMRLKRAIVERLKKEHPFASCERRQVHDGVDVERKLQGAH